MVETDDVEGLLPIMSDQDPMTVAAEHPREQPHVRLDVVDDEDRPGRIGRPLADDFGGRVTRWNDQIKQRRRHDPSVSFGRFVPEVCPNSPYKRVLGPTACDHRAIL